jgi:chaperonin GroES
MGEARFQPGEWKAVNATGDDLKKSIFPMPVRDPSNVLFELLNLLVQSGKELASVADVMTGKMPGQNTPATTTQSTIDQSMQLFTSIYKRVYRSLTEELKKLYRLNRIYLDPQVYISVLDDPVLQQDYMGPADDICPAADPNATSQTSKQARAQRLMSYMQLGTLNAMEVTQRLLDADEQPNIQQLLNTQPPPPDPKVQIMQMKQQLDQEKAQHKMQIDQMKAQLDAAQSTQKMQLEQQMNAAEIEFKKQEAMLDMAIRAQEAKMGLIQQHQEHQQEMVHTAQTNLMDHQAHLRQMAQGEEIHQAKVKQVKELASAKPSKQGGV